MEQKLSNIEKRMQQKRELDEKLASASFEEKIEIFEEIRRKEQKRKIEAQRKEKEKQLLFRKLGLSIAVFGGVAVLSTGGYHLYKQKNSPINIVTNDMLANTNPNRSIDTTISDPIKFEKNDTEELYKYIKENNIENEDIYKLVEKKCRKEMWNYNDKLIDLYTTYPEVFDEAIKTKK